MNNTVFVLSKYFEWSEESTIIGHTLTLDKAIEKAKSEVDKMLELDIENAKKEGSSEEDLPCYGEEYGLEKIDDNSYIYSYTDTSGIEINVSALIE